MSKEVYDNLARGYDDMYSDPSDKLEDQELFGILGGIVGGKTLDIGCGTGILLDYLEVSDYYGVDPSREMLSKLDQKHPERRIMESTAEEFIGLVNGFDTIVALYGVGSYLDHTIFAKLHEQLAPGGKIMIMFYKPDYYPRFYDEDMKAELDANRNWTLVHHGFEHVYDWSHYVIGTNFEIPEWEVGKFK